MPLSNCWAQGTPLRVFQRSEFQLCVSSDKVERIFDWQDTYRKLILNYDKLKETRLGFRHLAYSAINFRMTFNDP